MLLFVQTDGPLETPVAEVEESALDLWETTLEALPRIGIALVFIVGGWAASRLLRWLLHRYFSRSHPPSFAQVMSKLAGWALLTALVLAATAVTFPSVKPVDLLAGLGFFSVAVGFAFQDILENTLAGVLLLFRQPFRSGDQIEVEGHRGTVDAITIRETRLTTFDNQHVLIPNADVYKSAIILQTEHENIRVDFVVGVAYDADLAETQSTIVESLSDLDVVDTERSPEALIDELGVSTININVRFWTDPRQHNVVIAKSDAIAAVVRALDDAGVEMPCDIVALQATDSFAAVMAGEGEVTASGSLKSAG